MSIPSIIDDKNLKIQSPSFTKAWWKTFYEKTNGLTEPKVFKNVLSNNDKQKFNDCIYRIIKDVSERKVASGFGVSIDGTVEPQNRNFFYNNAPLINEDLHTWCKRVFSNKKFGVILNGCQNYDRKIKAEVSQMFRVLLENYGIPTNGIEITLLFGNYGYTPLGFHIDPPGHKVIHLHLGPGNKQMYLIHKDKFEKQFGQIQGQKDYDKSIPQAEMYEFDEGDLFFMPIDYYHVGNTPELSFGVTVWHVEPSVTEVQKTITTELMKKVFPSTDDQTLVTRDLNAVDDISHIKSIMEGVTKIDENFETLSVKESLDRVIKEHRYKLFSNGFFYGFVQDQGAEIELPELNLSSCLKGVDPFKIYFMDGLNSATLFVQGKKIKVPNDWGLCANDLVKIVNKINDHKPHTLEEMFKPALDIWELDVILYVTKEIYKAGGIELI